jgi:hypothetical protein
VRIVGITTACHDTVRHNVGLLRAATNAGRGEEHVMIDGLWIMEFQGTEGVGGGVVVFTHGKALGGDNAFAYSGTFQLKDDQLTATINVKNFNPSIPNVLGIPGDFDLVVEGRVAGEVIEATGHLLAHADPKITVRFRKLHDLE